MPDNAKFDKLREIGYEIRACHFCQHGEFRERSAMFGKCLLHTYDHGKHTGESRGVSIVRQGSCPAFEAEPSAQGVLGDHAEFLPGRVAQELPSSTGKKQRKP